MYEKKLRDLVRETTLTITKENNVSLYTSPQPASSSPVPTPKILQTFLKTFHHFFGSFLDFFAHIDDPRMNRPGNYPLPSLFFTGLLIFLSRLQAVRQIKFRLHTEAAKATFHTLFGIASVPHGDTLNTTFSNLDPFVIFIFLFGKDILLLYCVQQGNPFLIKSLLFLGSNPNVADGNGITCLHFAAGRFQASYEITERLIQSGARIDPRSKNGSTPLFFALERGNFSIAKLLVTSGADPNAMNSIGKTPLWLAAFHGRVDLIRFLKKEGAANLGCVRGETAKDIARKWKMLSIVPEL